jgi:hypothetical protein
MKNKRSTFWEEDEGPAPIVHRVFLLNGGARCNVYAPRQNPDQPNSQTFDLRSNKERTAAEPKW